MSGFPHLQTRVYFVVGDGSVKVNGKVSGTVTKGPVPICNAVATPDELRVSVTGAGVGVGVEVAVGLGVGVGVGVPPPVLPELPQPANRHTSRQNKAIRSKQGRMSVLRGC